VSSRPELDDEHIDGACAWLNVESSVLQEIAQRDFGLDEAELTFDVQKRARKYLVDGFGSDGEDIANRFSGANLGEGLTPAELAQQLREIFAEPSLELAYYFLASRWGMLNILRDLGGTEDTFRIAWEETYRRISSVAGEAGATRAQQMVAEFANAAIGK
jgi:hypothetical protein